MVRHAFGQVHVQAVFQHRNGAFRTKNIIHDGLTGRTGGSNVEWGESVSDDQHLVGL